MHSNIQTGQQTPATPSELAFLCTVPESKVQQSIWGKSPGHQRQDQSFHMAFMGVLILYHYAPKRKRKLLGLYKHLLKSAYIYEDENATYSL